MIKKYIVHAGIKGQKWGIRRYQNEDGSLTSLGKERYGKGTGNSLEKDYRTANTQAIKTIGDGTSKSLNTAGKAIGDIGNNKSKTVNRKNYKKLSENELRAKINRLNLERNYGELTGDTKRVRSGRDWAREVLQTTGAVAGIAATIAGTVVAINQIKMGDTKNK